MGVLFGRGELTPRGRWLAIVAASLVMQVPYWFIAFWAAAEHADETYPIHFPLFGLAFVPLVFVVLAFGSRHQRAPGAVVKAMGLFLLVGLTVALLSVPVGLVAGLGAGAVPTLRRPSAVRNLRGRGIAVVLASLYVFVLLAVVDPEFALMSGAAVPLVVVGLADEVAIGRAEQRGDAVDGDT